jgi:periplasmic copper chaperone A
MRNGGSRCRDPDLLDVGPNSSTRNPLDASPDTRNKKTENEVKVSRYLFAFLLLAGALESLPVQSQEAKVGDLVISQPWSRSAPRGAELASAYLTIENKGTTPDRLIGGSTEIAEKLQIQQSSMVGGGLTLNPVEGGLTISPGDKVVLAPHAIHLTLSNLKSRMKKGTQVPMTLEFEKAGKVTVSFDVLSAASTGPVAPKASAPDDGKMKK